VQDLRSSGVVDSDLIQRLTVLAEDLAAPRENQASPTFRLLVEGRPRLLDPILTISTSIAYKLSSARFKFRSPRKKSEKREQQA
jgi:hypothetical protein